MSLRETILTDAGLPELRPRIDEMAATICEWTGSEDNAYRWYREHPIASLANKTAEQLVRERDLVLVLDFLRSSAEQTARTH